MGCHYCASETDNDLPSNHESSEQANTSEEKLILEELETIQSYVNAAICHRILSNLQEIFKDTNGEQIINQLISQSDTKCDLIFDKVSENILLALPIIMHKGFGDKSLN